MFASKVHMHRRSGWRARIELPLLGFVAVFASAGIGANAWAQIDTTVGGSVDTSTLLDRYAIVSASATNVGIVPDPAGFPRSVIRSTVRQTDNRVFGGQRAELSVRREYIKSGPRWYAMSVYIPATWQLSPYRIIVSQIQTSQKTAILQPPLAFAIEGSQFLLELHSNTRDTDSPDGATKSNSTGRVTTIAPLTLNRWNCWVVYANWSHTENVGTLKVWMNGAEVFTSNNEPNSYESWLGNNPRVGIYSPGTLGAAERQIFTDFVWVGADATTLQEISALTPCGIFK